MAILAVITDPDWLNTLETQGYHGEVNFWRPGKASFSEKHIGKPFVFVRKGTEPRKVLGYGVFKRNEELSVQDAWDRWGFRNGVMGLSEFTKRLQAVAERTATNSGGIQVNNFSSTTKLRCAILDQVALFPESEAPTTEQAFEKFGGLHRNIVSYKEFPEANLIDIFPSLRPNVSTSAPSEQVEQDPAIFGASHEERKSIENQAIQVLMDMFRGFEIEDVSTPDKASKTVGTNYPGYDYLLHLGEIEMHIKVKGTKSHQGRVNFTTNELIAANNDPKIMLFVVREIATEYVSDSWIAKGGIPNLYRWQNLSSLMDSIKNAEKAGLSASGTVWTVENPQKCGFLVKIGNRN